MLCCPRVPGKEMRIRPAPRKVLYNFGGKQLSLSSVCPTELERGVPVTLLESSLKTSSPKGRDPNERGLQGVGGCSLLTWSKGPPGAHLGKRDTCSSGQ